MHTSVHMCTYIYIYIEMPSNTFKYVTRGFAYLLLSDDGMTQLAVNSSPARQNKHGVIYT